MNTRKSIGLWTAAPFTATVGISALGQNDFDQQRESKCGSLVPRGGFRRERLGDRILENRRAKRGECGVETLRAEDDRRPHQSPDIRDDPHGSRSIQGNSSGGAGSASGTTTGGSAGGTIGGATGNPGTTTATPPAPPATNTPATPRPPPPAGSGNPSSGTSSTSGSNTASMMKMLTTDKRLLVMSLNASQGTALDRADATEQIAAHEQSIRLFRFASTTAQNANVKRFATQTLPTLQQHYSEIVTINRSL